MIKTFSQAHDLEKFNPDHNSSENRDVAMFREREFALEDILSVTTGRLVSKRHMDAVYDVIGFISGDKDVQTIGLSMLQDSVRDVIFTQHSTLQNIVPPKFEPDASKRDRLKISHDWLIAQQKIFGPSLVLSASAHSIKLGPDEIADHIQHRNPDARIIQVGLDLIGL